MISLKNIFMNIISKLHFLIVSLFILIFLFFSVLFITLQNGLFINKLDIANIHIKEFHIKWNEKIDISSKEIRVLKDDDASSIKIDQDKINHYFKTLTYTKTWFNSIVIDSFYYDDIKGSFKYHGKNRGFITLLSPDLNVSADISVQRDIITLEIENISDLKRDIHAYGNIYLDVKELNILTKININIADEANLTLLSQIGKEKLFYKIKSNKKILKYTNIINLLKLPKEVKYWAYDALKMKNIDIADAHGYIEFKKIEEAYKNFYLQAKVNNVGYTYNSKLDAIHANHVNLEFKNGSLFIYPKKAYSYDVSLGKSWIEVDFTQVKEELLSLHLLLNSALNKNILKILDAYKIKLPFVQKKGTLKTDLTLAIGLKNIDVDVRGSFYTKKANFDFAGSSIDIYNANIHLQNDKVKIHKMGLQYKDMAKANVDVTYNTHQQSGEINFNFKTVKIKDLSLKKESKPLVSILHIDKNHYTIDVKPSKWYYKKQLITLDSIKFPLNLKTLKLNIPRTSVKLKGVGSSFISGSINLKTMHTALKLDKLNFFYNDIKVNKLKSPIYLQYTDRLSISSKKEIVFSFSGSKYRVNKFHLDASNKEILIKDTTLQIGKFLKTKIYIKFKRVSKRANIRLDEFTLKDPDTNTLLYSKNKIILKAHLADNKTTISSKELGAEFLLQDSEWRFKLNSLSKIAKNSPLLRNLLLTKGRLEVYKKKNDKYIRFKSQINYPYKILVKNNIPVSKYKIRGKIDKKKIHIDINNNLSISIQDKIDIEMKNSVINLPQAIKVIKNLSLPTSNKSKALNIFVKGNDSYIYIGKKNKIKYTSLELQYKNKVLTSQLHYKNAKAELQLVGDRFYLKGENFDDQFMNNLFSLSKFSKGFLSFSFDGTFEQYSGLIYINKTLIKDFKTLNNVLAFVNTVPSLVTFKVPDYNTNGLFVQKAYIKFTQKNDIFNISDIYLNSKEIDIVGNGTADLIHDNIDISLNLKTDLGNEISKLPILGHLLLNNETLSTTLGIKGTLSNPKVESRVAKDIAVAPLHIIKRALHLPSDLVNDALDKTIKSE